MRRSHFLLVLALLCFSFQPARISWVAIGDSITYLNDHLNETGNRVTKGYLTRVTEKRPDLEYTNQGHNGWTAVRIATEIDKLGITKADLYTIFLGTNDWWGSKPLGAFTDYVNNTGTGTVYGSFRIIINKLHSLNDQAKIVLITPMQRSDFVYINNPKNNAYGSYKEKSGQQLEQFVEAVKQIGQEEKIPVLDLYHTAGMEIKKLVKFKRLKNPATGAYKDYVYPDYINIPFDPATDEYPYPPEASGITYDGLHPSDRGNEIIADKLVKIFKKINR